MKHHQRSIQSSAAPVPLRLTLESAANFVRADVGAYDHDQFVTRADAGVPFPAPAVDDGAGFRSARDIVHRRSSGRTGFALPASGCSWMRKYLSPINYEKECYQIAMTAWCQRRSGSLKINPTKLPFQCGQRQIDAIFSNRQYFLNSFYCSALM